MTSAPRCLAASSKDILVRMLGSLNMVATIRPRRAVAFAPCVWILWAACRMAPIWSAFRFCMSMNWLATDGSGN